MRVIYNRPLDFWGTICKKIAVNSQHKINIFNRNFKVLSDEDDAQILKIENIIKTKVDELEGTKDSDYLNRLLTASFYIINDFLRDTENYKTILGQLKQEVRELILEIDSELK